MPHDGTSLRDILIAAKLVQEGVNGFDKETLAADWVRLSAVIRQIEIIGEASRRLSKEFRLQHPEIPWREIVGMRDILIHAYDQLEIDDIWDTATRDIPDLISKVEPLVSNLPDQE
jgi:uncharacterized protein with HEPN domain